MEESEFAGDLEAACDLRERLDRDGGRLVFTTGCFDVLHVGHARYLQEARALGDALVVGLNGDGSVRALKGPGRPLNSAEDRGELLLALECVDGVVVFDGERSTGLIHAIRPHVYAKGGDYTVESLNAEERAALEGVGAEIRILSLVPGKSTSGTLAKMRDGAGGKLRLGVLGSGKGSNLQAILGAIERGELEAEVALVLSDVEGSGVMEMAREAGVEAVFVDAGKRGGRMSDAALKEVRDRLKAAGVELVVLAGFMRVLREPLLGEWEGKIVNIHPSLLPKYRGLRAWEQALEAGESEAGCTVHLVSEEVDGGEVLGQISVPVVPGESGEQLYARIQGAEHALYPKVIGEIGGRIRGNSCG